MKTTELFDLTGEIAIVTGGRGLYGASISSGLCEMGATVIIASRNKSVRNMQKSFAARATAP